MNKNNFKPFTKKELVWLSENRCEHNHTYASHLNCWRREHPYEKPGEIPERIGFLDIEASGLVGSFHYVFSWAIKKLDGEIIGRVLTSDEISNYKFDRILMKEFCKEVKNYDRIVVHYGLDRRFDIPFLRTRCSLYGLNFPLYKEIWVEDTWMMSRNKLKLHSNRLESICDFYSIPSKQHKLQPKIWMRGLTGHTPSLKYIWKHNIEDVVSLEKVWKKLNKYMPKVKRSI
jgi:uncharacterized protein YprB with RNaseH-like and TPR domain